MLTTHDITLLCRRAQQQFRQGAPFIVRNCQKRMNWDPHCMSRALKDKKEKDPDIQVLLMSPMRIFCSTVT